MRLSVIVEWANTRLNGVPRAWLMLDALARQWQELIDRRYPDGLPAESVEFLARLDCAEVLIASGDGAVRDLDGEIRRRLPPAVDVEVLVAEGLEYYPLKTRAAERARGDLLLFVDSDVLPDDGWLAHLLGSLGRPGIDVVCAQTYVAPTDLFARTFALAWTYSLRDPSRQLIPAGKFYANSIAFRADVYRRTGFPPLGRRTRGASSLIRRKLDRIGVQVWANYQAGVDHPPPADFRHLAVRAIAHGRDKYMTQSEDRHFSGLARSQRIAAERWVRGTYRICRDGRRIGLRPWEIPAALAICSSYYAFFALGGLMTHVNPSAMGARFRV